MTRSYARDEVRYDRTAIDVALAEGLAKAFETAKGTFYVLKTDHGSFKITPDQIVDAYEPEEDYFDPDAAYERYLETRYHDVIAYEEDLERQAGAIDFQEAWNRADADNAAEAELADGEPTVDEVDKLAREAAQNDSPEETLAAIRRAEDALLAKFGA